MEANKNFFQEYNMSESDINETTNKFVPESLSAKEYFLKQGEISDKIGFVTSGILKSFIYNDNADEITTQFYQPGSLIISIESFNNQVPSKENIIAIDHSELFVITYQILHELYQTIPVWRQICKDLADASLIDVGKRSVQMQTLSATERYNQFCIEYPEVVKKAPIGHIASYLGINIATLSRIRSKK